MRLINLIVVGSVALGGCGGGRVRGEDGGMASTAAASAAKAAPAVTADAAPGAAATPDPEHEMVVVTEVTLDGAWAKAVGTPPDRESLEALVRQRLVESSLFQLEPAVVPAGMHERTARLRAEYVLAAAPAGGGKPARIQAAVHMALEWKSGDEAFAPSVKVLSETPVARGRKPDSVAPAHIRRTLVDAATALVAQEQVRRGSAPQVIAALASSDTDLRDAAFATVAERRLGAAVPRLIELLRASDPEVRDSAIGALVAIRDPRAVKELTAVAKFQDLDALRRVIDAIGAIGGDEAEAYLQFVASGHDNATIRELAAQALERAKRKGPHANE